MAIDKAPIIRLDASIALGEIVHADGQWSKDINDFAARIGTSQIFVRSAADQEVISRRMVFEATDSRFSSSQNLVQNSIDNPRDVEGLMKLDGLSQAVALATLVDANTRNDQSIVDALTSGDEILVGNVLPNGLKELAPNVARVFLPDEIVDEVTRVSKLLSGDARDAERLTRAAERIEEIIANSSLPKDNIRIEIARDVARKMHNRADGLRGNNSRIDVTDPGDLSLLNMLSQKNVGGGAEGVNGKNMSPEMMRRMMEMRLNSFDEDEGKRWVVSVINTFADDSTLFFAGGWQQAIQYVDQSIAGLKEKMYNAGDASSAEKADKLKRTAGAMLNVAIQKGAIEGSDSTLSKYLNSVVPVDIVRSDSPYIWDKSARQAVLDFDPVVKKVYDLIYNQSISNNSVALKQVRDYLTNTDKTTDFFVNGMANDPNFIRARENGGPYYLRSMVKIAVDLFAIDDSPGWVAKVNRMAEAGQISWLPRSEVFAEKRAKTGIDGNKLVYSPKFDLKTADGKLQINHPVFAILDDVVGLQRLKGVYGEDILEPLEQGLNHIINYKWKFQTVDDHLVPDPLNRGRHKRKDFPRVSEMGWKDLGRIDKILSLAVGNPHGDKIESIDPKDVEPMVENAKNLFGTDFGKREVAGRGVGLIMAAKIEAAMTGITDDTISNLTRTGAVVFGLGKSETLNKQTEILYGRDFAGEVGLLRAQLDRLGINLDFKEFKDAMTKATTSTRNLDQAKFAKGARRGIAVGGVAQSAVEVLAAMAGIKTK